MPHILNRLTSQATEIANAQLARDIEAGQRAGRVRRPDWVPEGHPDGVPYIALSAGNSTASIVSDTVTFSEVDPEAPATTEALTDAQREGVRVELAIRDQIAKGNR